MVMTEWEKQKAELKYKQRINCNVPLCMATAEYEFNEVFFCAYHFNQIHVKGKIAN